MRNWKIIPTVATFEGDDSGPDPYASYYEIMRYCETHSGAAEEDVERIAGMYGCFVRWND